ncbi:hypothetical protein AW736_11700 [Termitidicoccus mucosus]|uniref:Uncharacterized protein n=1 Tax=Termitidicoccus mucosus TaxID=1184151 RepID=A0A178IJ86_9BACT|nr:hypothetical protein AW736_11700 [Opitutaceae bacterium TSB47]
MEAITKESTKVFRSVFLEIQNIAHSRHPNFSPHLSPADKKAPFLKGLLHVCESCERLIFF